MCGRCTDTKNELPSGDDRDVAALEWQARYNIRPTQPIRTLRILDHRIHESYLRWWLVPRRAPAPPGQLPVWKYTTFNARLEGIEHSRTFGPTLASQRCAVIADGFYEWTGPVGQRTPHHIFKPGHEPFAFAGVWDHWRSADGAFELSSCAIITEPAGDFMAAYHTRQPIILAVERINEWLDPLNVDWRRTLDFSPRPALEAYPVTKYLDKRGAEGPECMAPA